MSEKVKLRCLDYVAYNMCLYVVFRKDKKLLSAMCFITINILLRW